jgi:hypothetical protein
LNAAPVSTFPKDSHRADNASRQLLIPQQFITDKRKSSATLPCTMKRSALNSTPNPRLNRFWSYFDAAR